MSIIPTFSRPARTKRFYRRALAWFVTIPNRRDTNINMKHTVPLVQQRINDMQRKLQDPSYRYEEPVSPWFPLRLHLRMTSSPRTTSLPGWYANPSNEQPLTNAAPQLSPTVFSSWILVLSLLPLSLPPMHSLISSALLHLKILFLPSARKHWMCSVRAMASGQRQV